MRTRACLVLALALAPAADSLAAEPAEVVMRGGRINTMNRAQPWAEAVALRDGRIVYVGDSAGARALVGRDVRPVAVLMEGRVVSGALP